MGQLEQDFFLSWELVLSWGNDMPRRENEQLKPKGETIPGTDPLATRRPTIARWRLLATETNARRERAMQMIALYVQATIERTM